MKKNEQTEQTEIEKTIISKFIESKTPFAVIQYFENLIFNPDEKYRKYEIIYIGEVVTEKDGIEEKENAILYKKFTEDIELDFIFYKDKFNLVKSNEHGNVWEFMNFKDYKETIIKK